MGGAALQMFVLVDLHADRTDTESEKNQKFGDKLLSTAVTPFYAIFDAQGKDARNPAGERGLSDFNVPQRLVLSYAYDLPFSVKPSSWSAPQISRC